MLVVTVGSIPQRLVHLLHARAVNEEERADRQRPGSADGAGGGAAEVGDFAPRQQRYDFAERDEAQQVAEEDEEEQRPQEGQKAIGMFFEGRAEDLDAQKFKDRFEEVARAGWGIGVRLGE